MDNYDNHYEKKLELVRAIREENRTNEARMNHRENIFYGYSKPHQYGGVSFEKQNISNDKTADMEDIYKFKNSLILRMIVAVLAVLLFAGIVKGQQRAFFGITETDIKQYIQEDFSKQVVDYLANFTYTLDYEKTSVKR